MYQREEGARALFDFFFTPPTVARFLTDVELLAPRALLFDEIRRSYGAYDQYADASATYVNSAIDPARASGKGKV